MTSLIIKVETESSTCIQSMVNLWFPQLYLSHWQWVLYFRCTDRMRNIYLDLVINKLQTELFLPQRSLWWPTWRTERLQETRHKRSGQLGNTPNIWQHHRHSKNVFFVTDQTEPNNPDTGVLGVHTEINDFRTSTILKFDVDKFNCDTENLHPKLESTKCKFKYHVQNKYRSSQWLYLLLYI